MNNITLTIGDYSLDGHEKAVDYVYQVNVNAEELQNAYRRGCIRCGFDIDAFCGDYEQNEIPNEAAQKLSELGIVLNEYETNIEHATFNTENYAQSYMAIAKLGNPNIEYTPLKTENVNIGGYGLFY